MSASTKVTSLLLLCLVMSTGCGTFYTRNGDTHFGAYPYESVAFDAESAVEGVTGTAKYSFGELVGYLAIDLLSIPLDVCLDTVLLPVDLVQWARGKKKDHYLSVILPSL